jgi:hypothetical protein
MKKSENINKDLYDHILWILSHGCEEFQQRHNDNYQKVLEACLNEYVGIVKEVINDLFYLARVTSNCHYMNRIVKSHLQGRHSTAFTQLKNVLKDNADLYVTEVQVGELFYRMRSFEKRKGLSRKDLFHIPMSKKRIIKTQRYSAPGYPCLYLGKSIYGCWEEMHRPDTESTLISCFKSQEKLRVLDLRIPTLDEFLQEAEKYIQLFPFIIACDIPVRNVEDVYKPEYIIPQLILEWIIDSRFRNKDGLAGVYYTSANRNDDFYVLDHEWDNLAIPVQDSLSNEDFCPKLKQMFWCTRPTCYEYEHIKGNINATGYWDDGPNRKDSGGLKNDYYMSLFSRMEELIEKMPFYSVDTEELG